VGGNDITPAPLSGLSLCLSLSLSLSLPLLSLSIFCLSSLSLFVVPLFISLEGRRDNVTPGVGTVAAVTLVATMSTPRRFLVSVSLLSLPLSFLSLSLSLPPSLSPSLFISYAALLWLTLWLSCASPFQSAHFLFN